MKESGQYEWPEKKKARRTRASFMQCADENRSAYHQMGDTGLTACLEVSEITASEDRSDRTVAHDLSRVIDAWPILPDATRHAIIHLVDNFDRRTLSH